MRKGNYPCQTILHTLKFQDVLESNIMIKGIAIVKITANKSSCNSFVDSKIHILVNTTEDTNVIKAATTSLRNIRSKIKLLSTTLRAETAGMKL